MTKKAGGSAVVPHAELFPHGADIGVRGVGPTRASAFEQAALALTSAITNPGAMRVPAVLYGDEGLIAEMDDKVLEQIGKAWPPSGGRAAPARHHHQEPVDAERRRRGARRLQGQHGRRRGAHLAGLSRKVATLDPVICIKG